MGAATPSYKSTTPPPPETVRRADADGNKIRTAAKISAAGRAGAGGSDMTKGTLAMTGPSLLKQSLGG
jgi:hypothetical protein